VAVTGKRFLQACLHLVVAATSFVLFLYLFDWGLTEKMDLGHAIFFTCWMPLVLGICAAVASTLLILCCVGEFERLTTFAFGTGAGAFGMLVLRNVIVASDASLTTDPAFYHYWMGVLVVAIACGALAYCWRRHLVIFVSSITVGSFLFASGFMGILQLYIDGGASGWIFFGLFAIMCAIGALAQISVFRALQPEKEEKAERKRQGQQAELHKHQQSKGKADLEAGRKEEQQEDGQKAAAVVRNPFAKPAPSANKHVAAVRERAAERAAERSAATAATSSPLEFLNVLNPVSWFGGK